jgi:FKBP-type peptidyl-prolyl cis-trans isomerase FklB
MKKVLVSMILMGTFFYAAAQKPAKVVAKPAASKPVAAKSIFKNLSDSFSYAAGYAVATNMRSQNIKRVNAAIMQRAIDDVYKNKQPLIEPAKMNECLQRQSQVFGEEKMKEDKLNEGKVKEEAAPEIARGVAFLEANKKRNGVITLPNGLQYEVIKKADSVTAKPTLNDAVVVNYIGTTIDGREFDNSYKRGQPLTRAITGVIKGWTEILQLMSIGDKWKVYIPTELAYYLNSPDPSAIPPGAVLIFEMSLEGIKPGGSN